MSMVGEVEALPDLVCPSRVPETSWSAEDVSAFPGPPGIALPSEAIVRIGSRYSVHGSRFAVSRGHAVFPTWTIRRRSAEGFRRLGLPFRAHHNDPAGVLRGSSDPHGVLFPFSDIRAEVH
jgi:hypothetical protein